MRICGERVVAGLSLLSLTLACSGGEPAVDSAVSSWEALMNDGEAATLSVSAEPIDSGNARYCTDCSTTPLAWWKFDFCRSESTEIEDSATSTPIQHPAFRAVSVACVVGREGQAVRLAGGEDVIYSPDQPDYDFRQGLAIAAWINPTSVNRTQSLVRKRLAGTSAFTLAIENGDLAFVIRRTNRRLVGITAPIEAGRFAHAAATYDGQQMRLYLDGTLVAQTTAVGELAPGAGPIMIGNDASGREFEGVIDEVWLNTVAAPPDTVKGLNCVHMPPELGITPSTTLATGRNTPVSFDISVTNPTDPAFCPAASYVLVPTLPYPLSVDSWYVQVAVAPGETAHVTASILATEGGPPGPISFQYAAYDQANYSLSAVAKATFVLAD